MNASRGARRLGRVTRHDSGPHVAPLNKLVEEIKENVGSASAAVTTSTPSEIRRIHLELYLRQLEATRTHVTPHALRRAYITIGLQKGAPLREMQRAARHTKAGTTIAYDQSDCSFHGDPTFVLMSATAR